MKHFFHTISAFFVGSLVQNHNKLTPDMQAFKDSLYSLETPTISEDKLNMSNDFKAVKRDLNNSFKAYKVAHS